ncbi:CHAT domain-containing protein [uncultured Tateyamaria sp.]|uniref:CHAT domain-containing protein n=1 Tax=uncultured Tateyamaria sp. TaxID=455651 RepID=UPI00261E932C|nr:CHAT domain-containing protein [uncultured Tateyamaria sp.]
MTRFFTLLALMVPLGWGAMSTAQQDLPSAAFNAEIDAIFALNQMEVRAARLLEAGQIDAYDDALFAALGHIAENPVIPQVRAGLLLVTIADFYSTYRADFPTIHWALSAAIPILERDLGPDHFQTLFAKSIWIYSKRSEIAAEATWAPFGDTPVFWDGTEADKTPSAEDVEVLRKLANHARRHMSPLNAVTGMTEYVDILTRANRHPEALAVLRTILEEQAALRDAGRPLNPEINYLILEQLGSYFISAGQYEQALGVFQNGVDEVLALIERTHWQSALQGQGATSVEGRIYGQKYAMAVWQAARALPISQQNAYAPAAFEALQMSSYGPASAAVARATLRKRVQASPLGPLFDRWINAVPGTREEIALGEALDARLPAFLSGQMPVPLPLEQVQDTMIHADEALIMILPSTLFDSTGDDAFHGLVLAITQDGAALAGLDLPTFALSQGIGFLHHFLDPPDSAGGATRAPLANVQNTGPAATARLTAAFAFEEAKALHDAFFGAPQIAHLIQDKPEWTLIPMGNTLSLPFPALIVDDPGDPTQRMRSADDLRAVRWLGHERALTVVPSVAGLADLRQRQQQRRTNTARLSYVGFGDPAFAGAQGGSLPPVGTLLRSSGADRASALRALPRLPGTRREVQAMSQVFDTHNSLMFLDADATETRLRYLSARGAFDNIDVLHFATHGLLGGAFDGLSEPALAFTPEPGTDTPLRDGLLTATEAAQLNLNAEWVILSACDTAGDEGFGGDGVGGLAQGFLAAGARNLLVSHWRVDDLAAERLVTETVIASQTGGASKAEALRAAMAKLAQDTSRDGAALPHAHPSMWAPFLLIGGG